MVIKLIIVIEVNVFVDFEDVNIEYEIFLFVLVLFNREIEYLI